jgi:protein required for attachment to host cells
VEQESQAHQMALVRLGQIQFFLLLLLLVVDLEVVASLQLTAEVVAQVAAEVVEAQEPEPGEMAIPQQPLQAKGILVVIHLVFLALLVLVVVVVEPTKLGLTQQHHHRILLAKAATELFQQYLGHQLLMLVAVVVDCFQLVEQLV